MLRHYATYFDANYVGPATVAVASLLRTHDFDRLSLITPRLPTSYEPTPTWMMSRVVRSLVALDPRVEHVEVDEVVASGEDAALREVLARAHDSSANMLYLFVDTLMAYLYPWCGHPLVWFDSDLMFVGDTSGVFSHPWTAHGAAAPDVTSTLGDQGGLALYQRFVDYVNDMEQAAMPQGIPRNAGFVVLANDARPAYAAGLRRSVDFLDGSAYPYASGLFGQFAWNYAFHQLGAGTLPRRYNVATDVLPDAVPDGEAEDHLVRHYTGIQKHRMNLDFFLWFAGGHRTGGRLAV
jgi:hypothetical protein